jgi:hypothetical protein
VLYVAASEKYKSAGDSYLPSANKLAYFSVM